MLTRESWIFLSCGSQGSNSGLPMWQQGPLHNEPCWVGPGESFSKPASYYCYQIKGKIAKCFLVNEGGVAERVWAQV